MSKETRHTRKSLYNILHMSTSFAPATEPPRSLGSTIAAAPAQATEADIAPPQNRCHITTRRGSCTGRSESVGPPLPLQTGGYMRDPFGMKARRLATYCTCIFYGLNYFFHRVHFSIQHVHKLAIRMEGHLYSSWLNWISAGKTGLL